MRRHQLIDLATRALIGTGFIGGLLTLAALLG